MLTLILLALGLAQAPGGATVFDNKCAACHTSGDPRTPTVAALKQKTPQSIVDVLTNGVMRQQGSDLSDAEKRAVAEFLGTAAPAAAASPASTATANACASPPPFDAKGPQWNGWGVDLNNQRFQSAAQAGITAAQVPKLTLKWAFGFPNATTARALPTIVGGRVFVGSQSGLVYALDAKSGCTIWAFKAQSGVRTGVVIGPRSGQAGKFVAYFGDGRANQYAVDAATGDLIWTRQVDEHRSANLTGTPALYEGRLYVPVASSEEGQGANPKYECCTFRGSLVALDAQTGSLIWKTYTIASEAKPIGKNAVGTTRWGPAGGGIWSAPTVDPKRKVVYAATGNMYTEPQQPTSDSIVAFDLDSGRIAWVSQVTDKDVFVVGCGQLAGPQGNGANCPPAESLGPDHDFGNAPILVKRPDGKEVIVAGQKSGIGWAFDPDKRGAILWQYRAGKGGALGGLEFGSAVDNAQAYFAVSDTIGGGAPGGLHAVKLDDGTRAWYAAPETPKCGTARGCNNAILAAITVIPGVVFTGSNDGAIRGYSTTDGKLLWEYDTNHDFQTVNGVPAKGASISGPGPTIAGGMLFVNSGYGALGGRPGNVLLAFGIE